MKIVIVRHASPDYENNTLTSEGFKEIEALGKHYNASMFDDIYASPLTRAKLTAEAVVKGEKEIKYKDWLIEFVHRITTPEGEKGHLNWDFLPENIKTHPEALYNPNYLESYQPFKEINLKEDYEIVVSEFDKVLEKHGYKRNGLFYDVTKNNGDTIVFFCHLGIMCVLLSHILNIPYTILTQFTCCPPTGVTTLVSEERVKGIAQFRMTGFGDVSHLLKEGMEPAFHGRFCERFEDDTRH